MGSRASYVIKKKGQAKPYGSHWGASSILEHLFWGPDHATEVFEAQAELDELAEIEGGDEGYALVDWDARHLIWYGRQADLPIQRRLVNRILTENWEDWTVEPAVHGMDDLFNYLGIRLEDLVDEDEEDEDEDEDEEDEDEFDEEDEGEDTEGEDPLDYLRDEETLFEPAPISGPVRNVDDLELGQWLTIRDEDGSCRDYFGEFDDLDEHLEVGPRLIEFFRSLRQCGSPPQELATEYGVVIDLPRRTIWRWEGYHGRQPDKWFQKAWDGWQCKDLPGQWLEQMQITGREPGKLAADERQILAPTLADLLADTSIDPHELLSALSTFVKSARNSLVWITIAIGVLGIGLYWWLESAILAVIAGVLFGGCLVVTVWFWRITSLGAGVFDMAESLSRGERFPPGPPLQAKRQILNDVLSRLGYPSLEELEATGELARYDADDDEDYDDEDYDDEDYDDEDGDDDE